MNAFLTADLHFSHRGITQFLGATGQKLRPWDEPAAMDDALVARWNAVVRPKDKVYVLGDVCINRRALPQVARLHGRKHLLFGNHDLLRAEEYLTVFERLSGYHVMDNVVLSHIPIHPASLTRYRANVHGHLHDRSLDDPRYLCVSVEQWGYTPVPWETLRQQLAARGL